MPKNVIVVVNPKNRLSLRRPFRFNDWNVKDLTYSLNISGWCWCLAILGKNESDILHFLSGVSRMGCKWRHVPRGAGLEGASAHFEVI